MNEPNKELKLERIVNLPAKTIWKCWTEPTHLLPWFCPKPWLTVECRIDLRPGGEFYTKMKSPEGQEFPGTGVFLEVIQNKLLVWTNIFQPSWEPVERKSENDFFMTGIIRLDEISDTQTKYTAIARHWSVDDSKRHESMGFQEGWGIALDQLVEYSKTL